MDENRFRIQCVRGGENYFIEVLASDEHAARLKATSLGRVLPENPAPTPAQPVLTYVSPPAFQAGAGMGIAGMVLSACALVAASGLLAATQVKSPAYGAFAGVLAVFMPFGAIGGILAGGLAKEKSQGQRGGAAIWSGLAALLTGAAAVWMLMHQDSPLVWPISR